jgi:hypothetical protein
VPDGCTNLKIDCHCEVVRGLRQADRLSPFQDADWNKINALPTLLSQSKKVPEQCEFFFIFNILTPSLK